MNSIEKAESIATKAHAGQKRACGEDYINHPRRVAESVAHLGESYQAVAWLHDVVEDTEIELDDLRDAGFSEAVVLGVDALTRRDGQSYMDFIEHSSRTPLSKAVKVADIKDNLRNVEQYKPNLKTRYVQALGYLNTP